jgi:hypothetical protein
MSTYRLDPLHPFRIRCNACGEIIAPLAGPVSAFGLDHLTAHQVDQVFGPAAGQAAEVHDGRCESMQREER